ncbi:anti-sigma regulatory factor (Ser/Thr protein kinase) [Alkalibacillus flavidus]|uniref:Anti-sigma regulatory factor (Ser/Thr protein kinase) n=1 Tax=Alkalibacillus flavidus TaxID=546021 RepID=A0ABV2KYF9_9BACI
MAFGLKKLKNAAFKPRQDIVEIDPQITLTELVDRTIVGFLAKEIANELNLSYNTSQITFYSAIATRHTQYLYENGTLLNYANQLVDWCREQKNVRKQVQKLDASDQMKQAIITVYDRVNIDLKHALTRDSRQIHHPREWEIYREAMYASSQHKFLLINRNELKDISTGEFLTSHYIYEHHDITLCRQKVAKSLEAFQLSDQEKQGWLLVVSEIATNVLKHAKSGHMMVVKDDDEIKVVIEDDGDGFNLKNLPNLILLSGFSTHRSLGQGFTLVMKIVDRFYLYTTPYGSSIILSKKLLAQ